MPLLTQGTKGSLLENCTTQTSNLGWSLDYMGIQGSHLQPSCSCSKPSRKHEWTNLRTCLSFHRGECTVGSWCLMGWVITVLRWVGFFCLLHKTLAECYVLPQTISASSYLFSLSVHSLFAVHHCPVVLYIVYCMPVGKDQLACIIR